MIRMIMVIMMMVILTHSSRRQSRYRDHRYILSMMGQRIVFRYRMDSNIAPIVYTYMYI
jgi:hypothetical protein